MSSIQNINPYKSVDFFLSASFHSYFRSNLPRRLVEIFNDGIDHQKENHLPIIKLYKSFNDLKSLNLKSEDYDVLECVISSLVKLRGNAGDFIDDFIKFKSLQITDLEEKLLYSSLLKTTLVDVFDKVEMLKGAVRKESDPLKKELFNNISSRVSISNTCQTPTPPQNIIPEAFIRADTDDDDMELPMLYGTPETDSADSMFEEFEDLIPKLSEDLHEELVDKNDEIPEEEFCRVKEESCSAEDLDKLIASLDHIDSSWVEILNSAVKINSANNYNVIPLCIRFTKLASNNSNQKLKELLKECIDFYQEKKWDLTGLIETIDNTSSTNISDESISAFCSFLKVLREGKVKENILFPNKHTKGIISSGDFEECFSLLQEMQNIFKEDSIDYERLVELKMLFSQIDRGLQFLDGTGPPINSFGRRAIKKNTYNSNLRRYFLEHKEHLPFIEAVGRVSSKRLKDESFPYRRHSNNYELNILAHELKEGTFSIQPFVALNSALEKNELSNPEEIQKVFDKIVIHSLLSVITRSSNESTRQEAAQILSHLTTADDTPFRYMDEIKQRRGWSDTLGETATEVNQQTLKISERAFNIHHGSFSALTYECKRTPDREFPLLVRFAAEVGKKEKDEPVKSIEFVDGKEVDKFPGRGFIISDLDPHKIFVADKNNKENPFHIYKDAWTNRKAGVSVGDDFDDFEKTRFVFTRGLIAITGPKTPKYLIKDRNNAYTHYSLVVYNDHFENRFCNVAYLIPTKVLDDKLKDVSIKYNNFRGFGHAKKDSSKAGLDFNSIVQACNESDSNILDLTWGSNFGGTLSNSFPPKKPPYHAWETLNRGTKDINGHTHKTYSGQDLSTFREAHYKVYLASKAYFNLFDLFNLSLEIYHKGETSGNIIQIGEIDEFELAGLENEQLDPEEGSGINPNAILMLKEAYKWHQSKEKPILVPINALDNWGVISNPPFILDTKDLTLKLATGFTYRFPESEEGIGSEERMVWNSALKYVVGPDKFHLGLRFLDRELIPTNIFSSV